MVGVGIFCVYVLLYSILCSVNIHILLIIIIIVIITIIPAHKSHFQILLFRLFFWHCFCANLLLIFNAI